MIEDKDIELHIDRETLLQEYISRKDYEQRLKADLVAMLTELQLEIEKHTMTSGVTNQDTWNECVACMSRVVQEQIKVLEQESNTRNCFGCKYSKDNHNAGTEECHLCMWENQYTPTTKNDFYTKDRRI